MGPTGRTDRRDVATHAPDHRLAYDSVRQRVEMFGGFAFFSLLRDTWEWDGVT